MIAIDIDSEIREACPDLRLGCMAGKVVVKKDVPGLWAAIDATIAERQQTLGDIPAIAQLTAIQETRQGYKNCGKDPARYRPSAESLLRRVMQKKGLYTINNFVDLLNLVSIRSGFSIGGYDLEKIEGAVLAGIGKADEPYEGIGRGALNIAHLPLLRDTKGAFGSPTSDSMRTMVSLQTQSFLMVFFAFGPTANLADAMNDAEQMLLTYGGATELSSKII